MRQKLRTVKLSDEDWAKLDAYAQAKGYRSRAEVIRRLLDMVVVQPMTKDGEANGKFPSSVVMATL